MKRRGLLCATAAVVLLAALAASIAADGATDHPRAAARRAGAVKSAGGLYAQTLRALLRARQIGPPAVCSVSGGECVRGCIVPAAGAPGSPAIADPGCEAAARLTPCVLPIASAPGTVRAAPELCRPSSSAPLRELRAPGKTGP